MGNFKLHFHRDLILVLSVFLIISVLSSCTAVSNEPRALVDTETLEIVIAGRQITVTDREAGRTYSFARKHSSDCAARLTPCKAVSNDRIVIEIYPGCCLKVHDVEKGLCYTLQPRKPR